MEQKKRWTERLEIMDRRIIFLFVAAAVLYPFIKPFTVKLSVTQPVKDFYQRIEKLQPGSVILLSADWDPGSRAELYPVTIAVLEQLFTKNIRIIGLSLWPAGPKMLDDCFKEVLQNYNRKYGVDYINLGFKEGREVVMVAMGEKITQAFPEDFAQQPVNQFPIMKGIINYENFPLIISVSAGYPGTKEWVQQVQKRFKKDLISACAGVSSPEYYPYYESGQLLGLIGGLKAAAEYEILLNKPGRAVKAQGSQALGHYTIVAFIIFGNILYLINRRYLK
ncbi:MAG: hypothetical protein A2161_16045 [Candidatus Schekmanbacteria bacterium RBG_13_48_7]|uniref:Uncharacterized protein n=1 Tax=Candidatus Schekmanbacteria bacterium RBG_13_48_7 TaxID=1817878 RepID=A0A1F7RR88_9BACT|nr:MAG: hypothetical protein A2161_16045 [Candidatus Schekmanbacteria bacterium RBG_13_48_7]